MYPGYLIGDLRTSYTTLWDRINQAGSKRKQHSWLTEVTFWFKKLF